MINNQPLLYPPEDGEGVVDGNWTKGEHQPSACRDVFFAIAFIAQIVGTCAIAGIYGAEAFTSIMTKTNKDANETIAEVDYSGIRKAAIATGGFSLITSMLMLTVMIKFGSFLIKLSLFFTVAYALFILVLSLAVGNIKLAIIGVLCFAMTACYACCVWSRIPFATCNLVTGLTAIRANFGITIISYLFSAVSFGWNIVWCLAFLGVYEQSPDIEGSDEKNEKTLNYTYLLLLCLSFYWSLQVFTNVMHTSVAGMVGTWWFVPEEAMSFCSSAVTSSVYRSCTYSFGSICFGSFLVTLIKGLRMLANNSRDNRDANDIYGCIIDCILSCIERLIEYFNKWAFVYIGIYGYGYLEAGKNISTLFADRGWSVILNDNLVDNCLGLLSILLASISGTFGLIQEATSSWFEVFGDDLSKPSAFTFAFLTGLIISNITFSIVSAAVDSSIVLFAEAPAEFAINHPSLSSKMQAAYVAAFPDFM